jgi:hypothetical protein
MEAAVMIPMLATPGPPARSMISFQISPLSSLRLPPPRTSDGLKEGMRLEREMMM